MATSDRESTGGSDRPRTRGEELACFIAYELSRQRDRYGKVGPSRALPHRHRTGIILLVLLLAGFLAVFSSSHIQSILSVASDCDSTVNKTQNQTGQRAIALIDGMANEYPNSGFIDNISSAAKSAGYRFDYYPSGNATVDFFVNLPSRDYSIIILRTHGTGVVATDPAALVTSEHYSDSQYVGDQLTDRVASVDVNGIRFFALEPSFVSDVMCGRFAGTLILGMYCGGAEHASLARAFVEKGAGAYVGWDRMVTVFHTDLTFESLVKLILKGDRVDRSINEVMTTLGPDPIYGARLTSYSQNSFHSEDTPLWQQYWYIISAGIAVTIFFLAKVRNAPTKRRVP